MRRPLVPVVVLLGHLAQSATLIAQNSFVVPANRATRSGNGPVLQLVPNANEQPARVQCVWDRTEVPIHVGAFFGLDLRRTQFGPFRSSPNPNATWNIDLTLATGPNGGFSVSTTFANNVSANATVVFSGQLNLPPGTEVAVPAPFTVNIPFTTLFLYLPSSDLGLVADFRVHGYQPTVGNRWLFDGHGVAGPAETCCFPNSSCRLSNGNASNSYFVLSPMAPGAPLVIQYPGLLPSAPGAVAIGTQGPGGSWGGIPLPIDLTAAGAPGCLWYIRVFLWMPAICDASGSLRWPAVQVPNDPLLAGTGPWFHQGLVLDPYANSLGAVATLAASWYFGNQTLPPGRIVYRFADAAMNPTGTIEQRVLIAQFRY